MKRKAASAEAVERIERGNADKIWFTNCRWCKKEVRGTKDYLIEVARQHGLGKCINVA